MSTTNPESTNRGFFTESRLFHFKRSENSFLRDYFFVSFDINLVQPCRMNKPLEFVKKMVDSEFEISG